MYDINFKKINNKKLRYIFLFFLNLLLAFFIIGICIYTKALKSKLDSKVISSDYVIKEIVNKSGDKKYTPVYYFKVKNKEYTCESRSSANYTDYENKYVYYDSKKPDRCLTTDDLRNSNYVLIFLVIPGFFMIYFLRKVSKHDKFVDKLKRLNEVGTLVKNMPYEVIEDNGYSVLVEVKYELSKRNVLSLVSDKINSSKLNKESNTIDLLIDDAYPEVYYIDFNINRLEGNTENDYYKVKEEDVIPDINSK